MMRHRNHQTTFSVRVRPKNGFTLLEMVFVLGLVAILVTWLTVSVSTVSTEKKLRDAAGEIEVLAKRARNIAVVQQRPYQITIAAGEVSISPQFALPEDAALPDEPEEGEVVQRENFEDVRASEKTDPDVKYEIRRWMSDKWILIDDKEKVVLTIDTVGLIEPISIRCSVGNSWLIHELHPLTAGVRDEQMSVEKE